MMKRMYLVVLIVCAGMGLAYGQNSPVTDGADGKPAGTADTDSTSDQNGSKNLNVDMQLTYGQYNNMFSTISLSHEKDSFVYLLNSQFKRSNDFGYKDEVFFNTSYYENKIGFTGNLNVRDGWKTLIEGDVNGESHGMFENPVYTREEKEKYSFGAKNIVRQTSSIEWYAAVKYAGYTHRLAARDSVNNEKSNMNKIRGELGGEIIWSASNRLRANVYGTWAQYSEKNAPDDTYVRGEIIDDFKLTSSIAINAGVLGSWANDGGALYMGKPNQTDPKYRVPVNPVVGLTFLGSEAFSVSLQYRHDLESFRPENFYFDKKYVYPEYNLLPTRSHIAEGRFDIKGGDLLFIKGYCIAKKSVNYYNYQADSTMVLKAQRIDLTMVTAKLDATLSIFSNTLQLTGNYEYTYFKAPVHVTYIPSQAVIGSVNYNGTDWNIEWSNRYISKVYIHPETDERLKPAVIGFLGAQYRMQSGLYTYLRVENLYNARYNLRDGYPEAGVTVLGGIRILL
jgi:hypothetical protein